MPILLAATGMILSAVSALLLYLASPNQGLVSAHGRTRGFAVSGWLGLFVALVLLLGWAGPASAVFMLVTIGMLMWTIAPLLAAWWGRAKAPK